MQPAQKPGLPDKVYIVYKNGQKEMIKQNRIIRDRRGQILFCESAGDAKKIAGAASKFIGRHVAPAFYYDPKKTDVVVAIAFCLLGEEYAGHDGGIIGGSLPTAERITLESMTFFCARQREVERSTRPKKAKKKKLTAPGRN